MVGEERLEVIDAILRLVSTLSTDEKSILLDKLGKSQSSPKLSESIPISVFRAPISGLEIIVRYLKDNAKKSFKDIAHILNRKPSTIYNTYTNSTRKFRGDLDLSDSSLSLPFNIFSDRSFSILESLVVYLKDKENISFNNIASLLHKNHNTIRTVYRRYKQKETKEKEAKGE